MTEDNAGLVVSFYEAVHNAHDLTVLDTAVDSAVVSRWSGLPEMHGSPELRAALAADLAGFPDHSMELDQVVADGKDVASRWTYRGTHTGEYYGIPATGRSIVSTVVCFDRISNGKVAENWVVFDNYDVMRQLGLVPDTEETPA